MTKIVIKMQSYTVFVLCMEHLGFISGVVLHTFMGKNLATEQASEE